MNYKTIKGHSNYTIYEDGTILNHTTFHIHKHTKCLGRSPVVRLIDDNKNTKNNCLSILLAEHFLYGPNPKGKTRVSFKDKDPNNIQLDNLYIGKYGDCSIRYNEEEKIKAKKEAHKRCRNKRDKKGLVKPEQRKWRQSEGGKFVRNRNHWIAAKIREPDEGWENFYFKKFLPASHCELCNTTFLPDEDYMSQKCLEHDHHSGYYRSICCRRCNSGPMKTFDGNRNYLIIELHRYFNRELKINSNYYNK